jgi:hypothetical protein
VRRNWQTPGGWSCNASNSSIRLWLSSTHGISKEKPQEVIENRAQKIKIQSYSRQRLEYEKADTTLDSLIRIGRKGGKLQLDIEERSDDQDRTFTTNFLKNISQELTQLGKSIEATQFGFDPKLLAPKSIINTTKPVFQIESHTVGCSEMSNDSTTISGYVNPGEEGYIYVTTEFETNRGRDSAKLELYGAVEADEYVGWSDNPAEKFFFYLSGGINGDDQGDRPVKFRLWFHPSKGGVDRILLEKTQVAMVHTGMWGDSFKGKKE